MSKTVFYIAIAAAALTAGSADAQIFNQGIYQLPTDDFTFTWGDLSKRRETDFLDLRASGVEETFNCDLSMMLAPRSPLTEVDMRNLANEISAGLDFIYQAVVAMNTLDYSRDIEWATLVCKMGSDAEPDPDGRAEREAKARERALRAQQRRRERNDD
jgi:hypothetical protein